MAGEAGDQTAVPQQPAIPAKLAEAQVEERTA